MSETILSVLEYYGAAAGLLAAFMVSMNRSSRFTGYAFVIFVTSSLALIAWGFMNEEGAGIGWQNIGLLAINLFGVYRYLLASGEKDERSVSKA